MPLLPCPSCQRHIRADETSCPFCKAKHAGRKAAGLLAATLGAALVTGCPNDRPAAKYGAPPPPNTPVPPPQPSAAPDDTPAATLAPRLSPDDRAVAEYGAPPPPRSAAEYGAPPPPMRDVSPDEPDEERTAPKYGAPPPPREPR